MIRRKSPVGRIEFKWLALPMLALSLAGCSQPTPAEPPAVEEPAATEAMEPAPIAATEPIPTAELSAMTGDVTLMVATSVEYGDYLVNGDSMSIYVFQEDLTDVSTCTGSCAENWPPVTAAAAASEAGVDATLLSATTRDDGAMQVTYNGHPLYYYGKDTAPGDTNGHGVGDLWYLVSPTGEKIE